jgi:hypothetical protein
LENVRDAPASPDLDTEIPEIEMSLREVARSGINLLTINTTRPVNPANALIVGCVSVLQAANIFTQNEVDAFWNVFRIDTSRAENEFGRLLTERDIDRARWHDQVTAFRDLRNSRAQELATIDALLADLESGNAYHELSEVE